MVLPPATPERRTGRRWALVLSWVAVVAVIPAAVLLVSHLDDGEQVGTGSADSPGAVSLTTTTALFTVTVDDTPVVLPTSAPSTPSTIATTPAPSTSVAVLDESTGSSPATTAASSAAQPAEDNTATVITGGPKLTGWVPLSTPPGP